MKKLFVLAALLSCGLILFSCSHGNSGTGGGGDSSVNSGENTGGNNGNSGESSGGENETPSVAPVPATPEPPSEVSSKSGVMLQGFNWASAPRGNYNNENRSPYWDKWYKIVTSNADSIKDTFEYVWCPPPSKTDTSSSEGYGPTQLNDLNNCYGTAEELKAMISAISPAKAIADIVVNHRAGSTSWGDFTNPDWGVVKGENYSVICSDDEGFRGEPSLMGKVDSSKRGKPDTGATYDAYRDLDHTNTVVQEGIVKWMNEVLKPAGFYGWRYDYVKGFGGTYVGKYNKDSSAGFSVGEYWPTAGYNSGNPSAWGNEIKSWISKTAEGGTRSKAFDFALKGAMNTVFGNNGSNKNNSNYALLADSSNLYISQPEDAVTFVDNHDTGSTQNHWYLDPADIGTAYTLILTHPGVPCVAWQHYFTYGQSDNGYSAGQSQYIGGSTVPGTSMTYREHIDYLIKLRKSVGIEYDSKWEKVSATGSQYVARITGTNGELTVSIGSAWNPSGDGYAGNGAVYSGTNFAVYQKGVNGKGNTGTGGTGTGGEVSVSGISVTVPDWTWSDNVEVFAWAWGGSNNGSWIKCTGSGTSVVFDLPSGCTEFLLVRCVSGTTQPNWEIKDKNNSSSGRIYNQTENIKVSGGTYTVSSFSEYPKK